VGALVSLETVRLVYAAARQPAPLYLGEVWSRVWVLAWEQIHMQISSEVA
jgi:hypothetical protein